jgi:hypothetical protein
MAGEALQAPAAVRVEGAVATFAKWRLFPSAITRGDGVDAVAARHSRRSV